jgi:hypothetical protein
MAEMNTRKSAFRRRLRLRYLLPLLAIIVFSVVSYAASVTVTTNTYQSVNGVYYNVIGGITAVSNGFLVVQAGAATNSPCAWSATGATCNTALTAGDWYYSVTLTQAAGLTTGSHTLTVQWNTGSGYGNMGTGTLTITIATVNSGYTMTCLIDTGSGTFTAPTGIVITVT